MSISSQMFYAGYIAFVLLLLWKDMSVSTSNEKQIPVTKVGQLSANIGPTMKVLYCYSCGYKNLFERYAEIINQKYPELNIHGENFDPPVINLFLAKGIEVIKMVSLICILFGINIFNNFGAQSPSWWNWCMENKIYSCLMIFFFSNAIEGHLISTGAFEIILNDIPVWSKLETGRPPEPPELFQIIQRHLMLDPVEMDSFPK